MRRADRQTHSDATVLLLTHLPTVLSRNSYRVRSFLHESRVIHHPGHHWSLLLHGRKYVAAHLFQQVFVTPGGIRHDVVQRLMGLPQVVRTEAGRHRLDTLALSRQQQAGAIRLQRNSSIQVPRGLRQAIEIGREAFLLGAWRNRLGAHELQPTTTRVGTAWNFSRRYIFYNTVVLAGC